jgi:putative acetyltransferase
MIHIRSETSADSAAIHQVEAQAFGRPNEASLVDTLREHHQIALSLVAVRNNEIVGHILFCSVVIEGAHTTFDAVGLGPMAVLPQYQHQSIGTQLVRSGLDMLRQAGQQVVVVLGHPDFYPRFGFQPAARRSIRSQWDVPDDVFMIAELAPGALDGVTGTVIYPSEFDNV